MSVFEYEEDFSILSQTDFEITNIKDFKTQSELQREEIEKYSEVEKYINSTFNNIIKSTNWKYESYDIVICPKCSKTKAYCFHGLDTFSGIEIIIINCKVCNFTINRHDKVISGDRKEKGPEVLGTKIPIYSGVLIKR